MGQQQGTASGAGRKGSSGVRGWMGPDPRMEPCCSAGAGQRRRRGGREHVGACRGTCASNFPGTHQPKVRLWSSECLAMPEYPDTFWVSVSPTVERGQGADHIGVQSLQGCQAMPASEDAIRRSLLGSPRVRAAPSPSRSRSRSPSPPPPRLGCRAPAPAPPPVCDGGRAAGRAERSGAAT